MLPELVRRGWTPDLVTDQTSAHDPMWGYLPPARADEDVNQLRASNPDEYLARAREAMAAHVRAILTLQQRGAVAFDYGNNLREQARLAGVADAFDYPGFVPAFIRDSFCEGRGPFRWVAPAATRPTSARRTPRCASSSPTTRACSTGSATPPTTSPSRACPRASAGSATASATAPGGSSTRWSRTAA